MPSDRVSYTLDSTLETVNNAEETATRMETRSEGITVPEPAFASLATVTPGSKCRPDHGARAN